MEIYEILKKNESIFSYKQLKDALDKMDKLILELPNEKRETIIKRILNAGGLDGETINSNAKYFGRFESDSHGDVQYLVLTKLPCNTPREEQLFLRMQWFEFYKFLSLLTHAIDRICVADGSNIQYTACRIFPPAQVEEEDSYTDAPKRGQRRSPSNLSAEKISELMYLVTGCTHGSMFGQTNVVASKILARLFGGKAGTFKNALTGKWQYDNRKQQEMEEFINSEKEWLKSIGFVEQ